jgi:general L-amino acid transport system permease protein
VEADTVADATARDSAPPTTPAAEIERQLPETATPWLPGALNWLRCNLFSSWWNTLLTLLVLAFIAMLLPPLIGWTVMRATVSGTTRATCGPDGACWTFIRVRLPVFFYGDYPIAERWRVDLAGALLVGFGLPVIRENTPRRWLWLVLLLTLFPLLAGILLVGGIFGLPYVSTVLWAGLMLNVVVSFVTVAGSLPLGILLALGRRSRLPIVRRFSVGYIELWRGVPLLTVLFMSAVMVPVFLPEGVSIDRLVRALAAFVLFNAAYMAEVVRGGLQGVAAGQDQAADALGLRWWQVQVVVVLPQALKIAVPGIINTVVDLFKDTTLVMLIGLSDVFGTVDQALKDPAWLGEAKEGYLFSAAVFFVCCYAMSAYGRSMEHRLARSA